MAKSTRIKDPRQLPVQLNMQIPWSFREFLITQAETEGLSLNKLVTQMLMEKYGATYHRMEATHRVAESGWDG